MSTPPFEVLEHTADVGIKAHARTLPELFVNAAKGLVALASGGREEQGGESGEPLPIAVAGADLEDLLVNWLSEILWNMDAAGWEFSGFSVHEIGARGEGEITITGEALGQRSELAQRSRSIPVKAVTYHQISIHRTNDSWEAVIYFDI